MFSDYHILNHTLRLITNCQYLLSVAMYFTMYLRRQITNTVPLFFLSIVFNVILSNELLPYYKQQW
jgi:hypothetical protein